MDLDSQGKVFQTVLSDGKQLSKKDTTLFASGMVDIAAKALTQSVNSPNKISPDFTGSLLEAANQVSKWKQKFFFSNKSLQKRQKNFKKNFS